MGIEKYTRWTYCTTLLSLQQIFRRSNFATMLERSYNNTNIKKGDRKLSNNYRPINLTVIFCRMLEAIIRDKIMSYFASNGFFCSEQFRFRSK